MTWSQTPVVSYLLAFVLLWVAPYSHLRLMPSTKSRVSAFYAVTAYYPNDHDYTFFGALYRPCILDLTQLRTSITGFAREPHYCPVGYTLGRWDYSVSQPVGTEAPTG